MNVEIWTEATQFLFCEYVNGIFVTVHSQPLSYSHDTVPLKAQPGPWRFIKYLFRRQDRSHPSCSYPLPPPTPQPHPPPDAEGGGGRGEGRASYY
jgi:hypothetical protein